MLMLENTHFHENLLPFYVSVNWWLNCMNLYDAILAFPLMVRGAYFFLKIISI